MLTGIPSAQFTSGYLFPGFCFPVFIMSVFLIFLVIHYFVRHALGYDHIMAFQPVLGKRDVRVYIEPSLEKGGFGIEHPFVIGAAVILIDNRGRTAI